MVQFLPPGARRVLDVGCGSGSFGEHLKGEFPEVEVVGVESDSEAAKRASSRLDEVLVGAFPDTLPTGTFDVVYFNDVLEHMVDPTSAVRAARHLTTHVVASLPNVRHIDVVRDLVLRGDWTYQDEGVLDRTHLRFFTRKTAVELFERNGYDVLRTVPINPGSRNPQLAAILRSIRDHRFLPLQYALTAVVRAPAQDE